MIRSGWVGSVQPGEVKAAFRNDIVIDKEDSDDTEQENLPRCQAYVQGRGGETNLVRPKETDEDRSTTKQIPRIDQDGNSHADRECPFDGEVFRQERADIVPGRKDILEDTGEHSGICETESDEKASRTVLCVVVVGEDEVKVGEWVPVLA